MNVQRFYREVFEQSDMGLDVLGLEYRYRELVELIDSKTLPTFSKYVPAHYRTYLDMRDPNCLIIKEDQTKGAEYYLTDPNFDKFNVTINSIKAIGYNSADTTDPYDPDSTAYYSALINSRNNLTLESVLFGSEYTYNRTLTDSAIPWKKYSELRGPRTVYLENYPVNRYEILCEVDWPNIASMPEEYHEALVGLAILDCKIFLWNSLKYVEDVTLPNGNMNLRMDWSSAFNDRVEYLRDLRMRSGPDRIGRLYYTIL